MTTTIPTILEAVAHRPWPLPESRWIYYQEWNRALFLHWQVPRDVLKSLLPSHLEPDEHSGKCYVSLVAFTMEHIRPRVLPALSFISNFDEINLRTYVVKDDKPGVYFLTIEAGKRLSSFVAKTLSGLPYEYSHLRRSTNTYQAEHPTKPFHLNTRFNPGSQISKGDKSTLDNWLTERYALYLDSDENLYRYLIHHKPWNLQNVELQELRVSYDAGDMNLNQNNLHSTHYSEGVNVVSWGRERVVGVG